LTATFAAAIVALAAPARAEQAIGDSAIAFATSGATPDACPDERTFVAAVARLLHRVPGDTGVAPRLRIEASVEAHADVVDGRVTARQTEVGADPLGPHDVTPAMKRTLRGVTCREVSEGLALVVALTIDPLADPTAHVTMEPEPPQPVAPPPKERPIATPAPRPAPESSIQAAPRLGARVSPSLLPVTNAELFFGGAVGLRAAPHSSLLLDVGALLPSDELAAGGAVSFSGLEANGLLCPAWLHVRGAMEVAPCAGGGATYVSTAASGFARSASTHATVWYLGASALARVALTRQLGLTLEVGARALPTLYTWEIVGFGALGRTARIVGTASLAIDFRLL
jgi:hypothetical protein